MWRVHLCLAICLSSAEAGRIGVELLTSAYSFADYKSDFGRTYLNGTDEHQLREAIFYQRIQEIVAHNAKGSSWRKSVNHLTDLTAEELRARNGYKPSARKRNNDLSSSMIQLEPSGGACASHQSTCLSSGCCSDWSVAQRVTVCNRKRKMNSIGRRASPLPPVSWSRALVDLVGQLQQPPLFNSMQRSCRKADSAVFCHLRAC